MPNDEIAADALPDTPGAGQATGGGKVRVLVIDDEPEIRRAVQLGLASGEFAVAWRQTASAG